MLSFHNFVGDIIEKLCDSFFVWNAIGVSKMEPLETRIRSQNEFR